MTLTQEKVLDLYNAGTTNINEIAQQLKLHPAFVAQVLRQAGLLTGYFGSYLVSEEAQSVYSRFFRHVLSYKNVEAATKSIDRINSLYQYFEEIGDREGMHQAMVLALTGKNRARWSGKQEEAKIFGDWLNTH